MMSDSKFRNLIRTVFASIVSSDLTSNEIEMLANELRHGRFADELSYMLGQILPHIGNRAESKLVSQDVARIQNLISKRRISKAVLVSILHSLDFNFMSDPNRSTIRSILEDFTETSPQSRVSKLTDILENLSDSDSYLELISKSRKV